MSEEPVIKTNYSGNSYQDKAAKEEPQEEREEVKKVVSGKVVQQKKSLGRKISDAFTGDDAQSIMGYVIFDVVIPAGKDMLFDAVKEGFQRALYGDAPGRSSHTSYSSPLARNNNTPYNRASSNDWVPGGSQRTVSSSGRRNHKFEEVILETRGEAELVCEELIELIQKYGSATVADFYSLIGTTGEFTDTQHGWVDVRDIGQPKRLRNGWVMSLGKTEELR